MKPGLDEDQGGARGVFPRSNVPEPATLTLKRQPDIIAMPRPQCMTGFTDF